MARESGEKGRERKKGRGGGMEVELAVLYKGFVGRCRLRRREEGLTNRSSGGKTPDKASQTCNKPAANLQQTCSKPATNLQQCLQMVRNHQPHFSLKINNKRDLYPSIKKLKSKQTKKPSLAHQNINSRLHDNSKRGASDPRLQV